jgi:hypothetical protein
LRPKRVENRWLLDAVLRLPQDRQGEEQAGETGEVLIPVGLPGVGRSSSGAAAQESSCAASIRGVRVAAAFGLRRAARPERVLQGSGILMPHYAGTMMLICVPR